MSEMLSISVVYALPDQLFQRQLELPVGSTLSQALRASGLYDAFPELLETRLRCGIHSRLVGADTILDDGDRVEAYRPLSMNPMQARRQRARKRG